MARFKDPNFLAAAFYPYLQPGEQLRNIAFGVKQPNMLSDAFPSSSWRFCRESSLPRC